MCFESCELHDIKKWQSQNKKYQSFKNKHFKFLSRHFAENGKEKLFPNNTSLLSNLKNAKTNIILTN